jgi:DNA invertase Pin-like site-specific DNA recombinase
MAVYSSAYVSVANVRRRLSLLKDTGQISRLLLTVLGGLAEFDRKLIRARTGEGVKRANAVGDTIWTAAEVCTDDLAFYISD